MATGGYTNPHNHPSVNTHPSAREWNFSNGQRDVEQWNLMRLQMTNNLTQEREQHQDLPLHSLNVSGNCSTNKNNAQQQREKLSDKDENQSMDGSYPSCGPNLTKPPRGVPFQKSKYKTPASSFSLPTMNGVRQKNPSYNEQGSGDSPRNKADHITMSNQKRQHITDQKEMDARNIYRDVNAAAEAKENLGKMSNSSNQVLAHLKQIQDTMQQIKMTIETLKMTGTPKAEKRIQKLQKALDELRNSEQQLLGFLNKVSVLDQDDMQTSENGGQDSFDGSVDDDNGAEMFRQQGATADPVIRTDDGLAHKQRSDAIAKQVELLCKVKECEENLKMWQNRQAALTDIQQKTENRLAETKALRNQLEMNTEENEALSPMETQIAAASLVQDDLDCLQERLNALRDMSDLRDKNEETENSSVEHDRMELQNKLRDLQEKKKYMDSLLDELTAMRALRSQQILNNEATNENSNERGTSEPPTSVLRSAQDLLASLDTTEKFEKLKDMKHRIHHLQEMIANYQPNGQPSKTESDADTMFKSHSQPALLNHAASPLMEHSRKENMSRTPSSGQKKVNISREHSDEYLAHMSLEPATGFTDHSDRRQIGANIRMLAEGDAVFQEKLNKLKNARAKVSKLEKLLASLQDSQLPKDFNIADVQGLLEEMDEDSGRSQSFEQTDKVHGHESSVPMDDHYESLSSQEEHPSKILKRKNKSNRKFDDQRLELENLLEEGNKILAQHQEFTRMKQSLAENADKPLSASVQLSASASRLEPIAAGCKNRTRPDTVTKSNQQQPSSKNVTANQLSCDKNSLKNNVPKLATEEPQEDGNFLDSEFGNPEFWAEMRHQLILREELHQKRREVEELMRKDHGKSNTRNQDNMSDNISYSNKSDGVGMSFVGTEGTTAATWGGSTQENPEDQDEQNDTQEEVEEPDANEDVRNMWNKPAPHSANQTWSSHQQQPSRTSHAWNAGPEANEDRREPEPSNVGVDPANAYWAQQAACLQQHWEQMNAIRQSIIRDEHNLHSLFQQHSNLNANPGPANCSPVADFLRPCVPDICQHYSQHLQQQHLLINLNQCYHMLCLQTLEIQQIQQQLQQVLRVCAPILCTMEETQTPTSANISRPMESSQVHMVAPPHQSSCSSSHFTRPACGACPPISQSVLATRSFPSSLGNQTLPQPETLNNQVVPGIRTNNYWDNFRSYSRQNLLSTAPCNKGNQHPNSTLNNPHVGTTTAMSSGHDGLSQEAASNTNVGLGTGPMENPGHSAALKVHHALSVEAEDSQGSGEPCTRSTFESLREPIYSEVAALISQNEEYPQFLMQLFSDLQMLNSDYLRRSALVAIHNLIVQLGAENANSNAKRVKSTSFWGEANTHILSEPTASDSVMTSDDEVIRAHLVKMNKPAIKSETNASKRALAQGDAKYDLSHRVHDKHLADASSGYDGLLGDDGSSDFTTASVAARPKETNQPRRKLASTVTPKLNQNVTMSLPPQASLESAAGSRSEMENEKSTSDIPLDSLNTAQLDDQIQGIMLEVIPFLKEHLDEPCSPNILNYVCHLTLSLVAHLDDGVKLNQYFKRQLTSVLQETLNKYTGKRLRECGEDLLVNLSEALFNELAFLRLVQNMDDGSLATKSRRYHGLAQTSASSTSNDTSPKTKGGTAEGRIRQKERYNLQPHSTMGETDATDIDVTMQRTDEEDLGQSRDDAMAARCDIFETEDVSRASSLASVRIASSLPEVADKQRTAQNQSLPNDENASLPSAPEVQEEHENAFGEADHETEADELEDNQDLAEADQSQIQLSMEAAASPSHNVEQQFDVVSQCSEDLIRAEATEDDQAERLMMADSSVQGASNAEVAVAGAAAATVKGTTEQGLDEIPIKLSMADEDIQLRRQEEELQNSLIDEILQDSVEAELAESGMALRKPESR